jgi:aldose sugar dehydrogenase
MRLTRTVQDAHSDWVIVWHLLGLLLVLLVPTMARFGLPFWALAQQVPQVQVLAIGYLSTSLFLALSIHALDELPLWGAGLVAAACFGAPILLLELVGLGYSRIVVAAGIALGFSVASAPYVMSVRAFRIGLVPLVLASTIIVTLAVFRGLSPAEPASSQLRSTALHNVEVTYESGLVNPAPISGGGLDLYRSGVIVANGIGEFWRLTKEGSSFRSHPLDLPPILNRDAFIADKGTESEVGYFRIMDLLVDSLSTPNRILVSHYHWDPNDRCMSMRVSGIAVTAEAGAPPGSEWETLFRTEPCTPWREGMALSNEAGGRMAWGPNGTILLTVGGMRQLVLAAYGRVPREEHTDYGKILMIDPQGEHRVLTEGHRNPEGLMVAQDGSIWSTEHGPRGGDELNLIARGNHYGWPLATYGTEYDSNSWPLAEGRQDHGPYEEPVYAWVPSEGISSLIEVTGEQFPAWKGDFLVGALLGQALFRLRIRADRVIYSEPIRLNRRIRDLVEDEDGWVLIWTDEGDLVSLRSAGDAATGESIYLQQCASCHGRRGVDPATAPDLRGVVGRRAGRTSGYEFSSSFQRLDLTWTAEALDRFLSSPSEFAPGTTMGALEGLSGADRQAVIAFLGTYR